MVSISYHFKLLSHPNKLLYDHLKAVGDLSRKFVKEKLIEHVEHLSEVSYLIGISHDFGKANEMFQRKIKENYKTGKADHAMISGIWTYFVIKNYISAKNIKIDNLNLPIISYLVVSRHHSDLRDISGTTGEIQSLKDEKDHLIEQIREIRKNQEEIKNIYLSLCEGYIDICNIDEFFNNFENKIENLINELYRLSESNCDIYCYLTLLFLYSILLDADKVDASNTPLPKRIDIPPTLVDEFIKSKFSNNKNKIDIERDKIYHKVVSFSENFDPTKNKRFVIELPTGSGKTLISLSLALKMRDKIKNELKITPRIIYSLPFLSIIDQNGTVFAEVLGKISGLDWNEIFKMTDEYRKKKLDKKVNSNLLLIHHHLADMFYKTEEDEFEISKSRILTEGWNSEVIITTFIQIFHSLITNNNNSVRKFHNLINSIIILDEVQNIPYKYWNLLSEILYTLSEKYNTWIILMTATMPMLFKEGQYTPIVEKEYTQKYYRSFNRVLYKSDFNINKLEDLPLKIYKLFDETNDNILIILNRISAVKNLYLKLKELYDGGETDRYGIFRNEKKKIKIINLSTNIIPIHRFLRINEIKKNDGYKKIIISTQLIEAGVDISTKIVYRDIAPIDSIFQSGGRCNREYEYGDRGGIVYILNLKDENGPLWKYVYDSVLIETVNEILKNRKEFEEKDIREIIKEYFEKLINKKAVNKSILESIKKFRFSDINEFKLIEEKYPKEDIFVEIDEEATNLLKKFENLSSIKNPFERKNEFLKFKGEFYNYVVSVPENIVQNISIEKIGEIYIIHKEDLENIYDLETGIKFYNGALIL